MPAKLLITIGLLLASLSASANSGNNPYFYGEPNVTLQHKNSAYQLRNKPQDNRPKQHRQLAEQQSYISKAQAIEIARQRSNGKILSAKLVHRERQAFYKIKVLTDQGRIRTLRVNARRH